MNLNSLKTQERMKLKMMSNKVKEVNAIEARTTVLQSRIVNAIHLVDHVDILLIQLEKLIALPALTQTLESLHSLETVLEDAARKTKRRKKSQSTKLQSMLLTRDGE